MAKRVVKLTETDLQQIVKKILKEQQSPAVIQSHGVIGAPMSLKTAIAKDYPNAKKRTYKVLSVKGRPSIKKNGKDLLLTSGMAITPDDFLKFKGGDEITMASTSPEDKGRYFQQVSLYINPNGKLELFVYSD